MHLNLNRHKLLATLLLILVLILAIIAIGNLDIKNKQQPTTSSYYFTNIYGNKTATGYTAISDNRQSALIVATLNDVYESKSEIYVDLKFTKKISKVLVWNKDIKFGLKKQRTLELYPITKNYSHQVLEGNNIIRALEPYKNKEIILEAWLSGADIPLSKGILECNTLFVNSLLNDQGQELKCVPFIFSISLYEDR